MCNIHISEIYVFNGGVEIQETFSGSKGENQKKL